MVFDLISIGQHLTCTDKMGDAFIERFRLTGKGCSYSNMKYEVCQQLVAFARAGKCSLMMRAMSGMQTSLTGEALRCSCTVG